MVLDRIELKSARRLRGEVIPPPDKSISHRAVMFSSIATGKSLVRNFLRAVDTLTTLSAFRALGIEIEEMNDALTIHGKGILGLREPDNVIDCHNSGTTMRLLLGILSGNPFSSFLTGDESLRKRPMQRVIAPLQQMGAHIMGKAGDRYPPIVVKGGRLKPVTFTMPVASAQVKSAIILAGLYAEGETEVIEPLPSRDHTERMLPAFGAEIIVEGQRIINRGYRELYGIDTTVPGDFSSAAFFLIAGLLVKDSEIILREVGVNRTRTGLLDILGRMGADVKTGNLHYVSGEPVADIHCRGGTLLKAVHVEKKEVPLFIDEFPVLCVAASQAEGVTTIRGAEELRVKESDRIRAMATELRKLGVTIEEYPDGISIEGKAGLTGCEVESYGDHRIAMALSVAALISEGKTVLNDPSCVDISYPGFFSVLERLRET
jgi:3-phosphoshikimate 1-carboxyvinyltransferase